MSADPIITEFMASNDGTILDGDGRDSDWIEIFNPGHEALNLAGWHLTDRADNLNKWQFPDLPASVLGPQEYKLIFASSKESQPYVDPAGYLHTNFALSAGGEYLGLTTPEEVVISEYAPEFPPQITDISYGLLPNILETSLISWTHSTTAIVPADGSLDATPPGSPPAWTLAGFDDSGWRLSASGVGVGFDTASDDPPDNPDGVLLPGGLVGFDLTDPEENGLLDVSMEAGGESGSPSNERPPQALDGTASTKWLSFIPEGTYYQMRFFNGQRFAVDGYTLTSANDVPERDPYSWTLSGSNDGVQFTVIDTRVAQDFQNRFETRLYEFNNNTPYEYYRFDFQTEYGATGNNRPNSIQLAEIELLSTGPVNFGEWIDLDLADDWGPTRSGIYQRIEFDVAQPEEYRSLLLKMQYDDGFVAYLNGQQVAAANFTGQPTYLSRAGAERDDVDAVVPESFHLTPHLAALVPGTNVLAIHAVNASAESPDLLSRPELVAATLIDGTLLEAYMLTPTPGAPNVSQRATIGPRIENVTPSLAQPTANQSLVVSAEVTPRIGTVSDVALHYRVMFGPEVALPMRDDGVAPDLMSGDGVFTATIPSSAYTAGQMVRWYVTASDGTGEESRQPIFLNASDSPEYFGTVVLDAAVSTALPVFEYFVQNPSAAATRLGTQASVFFLGEFYDNVFVRRRGGNTTQGRKFEFHSGQHFLFDPQYGRVDEINLNERGAEPTYLRQVLAWEVYAAAGAPASLGQAWYTRRNGSYLDVRIFVEQPDADLLSRTGLDPNGAFYKIGAGGVENSVTSSTAGVTKRTRKFEDNSDLQALVDGVKSSNPARDEFVFDQIDIAAVINYLAATSIMHDNDHPHKNFHLYRDTEGSQQWTFLPWDKDLTFGINFGLSGIVADQDPFSHPFFGDRDHQKVDQKWNRMIDATLAAPGVKEMLVRRLRTLMDELLGANGNSWLDQRVAALTSQLQPHVGSSSWLGEVGKITNEYLVKRRQHLYVHHAASNPGYPDNAGIPPAQVGNPTILFGEYEADPASGNQDEEYIQLVNPHGTAVDISQWRIEGGISFTFRPGTVIPAGGSLYVAPDVPTFLARTSGPRGGQQLFVQGNYSGHIARTGEVLDLVAADGQLVSRLVTAGLPGDFDRNGAYDCADIDALISAIVQGTPNPEFDLNGDGRVDQADRDDWLDVAGAANLDSGAPYLLGDANLDGSVDVSDFNLWNSHKFTATASWCAGDFTADGLVDVSDFNLWNGNKFRSSGVGATANVDRAVLVPLARWNDQGVSEPPRRPAGSAREQLTREVDARLTSESPAGWAMVSRLAGAEAAGRTRGVWADLPRGPVAAVADRAPLDPIWADEFFAGGWEA